jgi:hypothetical protein
MCCLRSQKKKRVRVCSNFFATWITSDRLQTLPFPSGSLEELRVLVGLSAGDSEVATEAAHAQETLSHVVTLRKQRQDDDRKCQDENLEVQYSSHDTRIHECTSTQPNTQNWFWGTIGAAKTAGAYERGTGQDQGYYAQPGCAAYHVHTNLLPENEYARVP